MDGFKSLPKMQCFKEGGAVKYKSKHSESKEMEKDIAKDKQIVKKAFKIHDTQSHEGEKTDLSKLRKGGRIKKCGGGNVRKYKDGGMVTEEEKARMPKGPLPQEMTDKLAKEENEATRGAVTEAARKVKRAIMGRKQGGKAC